MQLENNSEIETAFLENPNGLVYAESRFKEEFSPMVIYVPSRLIMMKLMRACIACEFPGDLWIGGLEYTMTDHRENLDPDADENK